MSNVVLIVVGAALFLAGLAKLRSSQSGGFNRAYPVEADTHYM